MSTFLGFDLSTQSLSVIAIDSNFSTIKEANVNFDSELKFGTKGGALRHEDGATVTSPVLMWIQAIDILFSKLKQDNFNFSSVSAISASGQQHGSVYWKNNASSILKNLNPSDDLYSQLSENTFSVLDSPIWMDSSTSDICEEIENKFSAKRIADTTGSRCFERFTLSQIAKIIRNNKSAFLETERISLVSSFFVSLLCGFYAPIDAGDGSGMNAMNIYDKSWDKELLSYVSPEVDLEALLGPIQDSYKPVGKISSYFQSRYGFNSSAIVITASGDNPCTLAGLNIAVGGVSASLGTSDTLLGSIRKPIPSTIEGHIMCNCIDPSTYMGMICRKNGSLTREYIRNKYSNSNWNEFSSSLKNSHPGNNSKIGFYFLETEIYPAIKGFYYYDKGRGMKNDQEVEESTWTAEEHIRGVVESQFMLIALSASSIGFHVSHNILVTGGGAQNKEILQILADVFGVEVHLSQSFKSAALGAAFRAFHGLKCDQQGTFIPFNEVITCDNDGDIIHPNLDNTKIYESLIERYRTCLNRIMKK